MKALYGKATAINVRALQRLQSRVQTKLLNQLYFLDHSDPRHLISRRYQLECLDLLHKINILFAEGEYKLTERLLHRCLRLAEVGDFTHYAVQCIRLLCTIHAQKSQAIPYEKAVKYLLKAQQVMLWEDKVERIFTGTQLALARTVNSRRTVLLLLPDYINQLEALNKRARTFGTFHYLYRLRLAYEELQGNYQEMIREDGRRGPPSSRRQAQRAAVRFALQPFCKHLCLFTQPAASAGPAAGRGVQPGFSPVVGQLVLLSGALHIAGAACSAIQEGPAATGCNC